MSESKSSAFMSQSKIKYSIFQVMDVLVVVQVQDINIHVRIQVRGLSPRCQFFSPNSNQSRFSYSSTNYYYWHSSQSPSPSSCPSSSLDYCNGRFTFFNQKSVNRLQIVNSAAGLLTRTEIRMFYPLYTDTEPGSAPRFLPSRRQFSSWGKCGVSVN